MSTHYCLELFRDVRYKSLFPCTRWLLYEDENYNVEANATAVWWSWGIANFVQLDPWFFNRASSARYAGPFTGYKSSSLSLYQRDNFQGEVFFTSEDVANLTDGNMKVQSIILTGCEDWMVYA